MECHGFSDKGIVRTNNQDAFMIGKFEDGSSWAVVCDGMGGANGGNIASRLAVDYFSASLKAGYRSDMSESSVKNLLESAVNAANIRVFDKSRESDELNGMGTTLVAVIIINMTAYFIHAGDSRAYFIQNGNLKQITRDHSIVQTMVENGKISQEEAKFHPRKNVITRAIGVDEMINPEFNIMDISNDMKILLCTDGLTNYTDAVDINSILTNYSGADCAKKLVDEANRNGGGDNITAVVIDNI